MIVGLIRPAWSMPLPLMGFVATAPLAGDAIGLIFVVPLSDLVENRRLVLGMPGLAVLSAALASVAFTPTLFLIALLGRGVSCSCIQVLVLIAASMVPPQVRCRVVGEVVAGLMVGFLSARPLASVADTFGWRFVYVFGALTMAATIPALARGLSPLHWQGQAATCPALISSL